MKYIAFVVLAVASGFAGWIAAQHRHKDHVVNVTTASGEIDAQKIAAMIESADRIGFRLENQKADQEAVIYDKNRIKSLGDRISVTIFGRKEHCLCTGWRTAHFYRNDQELLRIAAIHDNQLRIYWSQGGGDYSVSESDWEAMHAALSPPQTR